MITQCIAARHYSVTIGSTLYGMVEDRKAAQDHEHSPAICTIHMYRANEFRRATKLSARSLLTASAAAFATTILQSVLRDSSRRPQAWLSEEARADIARA
jgi:hypothetical protein